MNTFLWLWARTVRVALCDHSISVSAELISQILALGDCLILSSVRPHVASTWLQSESLLMSLSQLAAFTSGIKITDRLILLSETCI